MRDEHATENLSGNPEESAQAASTPAEIRLALVMNGGVSLAVWMGGVAHELDLLRRASDLTVNLDEVEERDKPIFLKWRKFCGGKRVVIDIISGTSAGGLNGLFLATAIARNAPLPDLRALWQSSASLDQLREGRQKNSVLNGRYFERKIDEALKGIQNHGNNVGEITLFVTATALDGECKSYKDSYGQLFNVNDHRRVYRFESASKPLIYGKKEGQENWSTYEGKDKDHFATEKSEVLRQAARATASFPIAFQPVSELDLLPYRIIPDAAHAASSVMDGGVLNNEPFGPVLDEITARKTSGPVERIVAYIVPSGGRLAEEKARHQQAQEITWATAGLSAFNYPQEVNFRSGVEELNNRLQTSGRLARDQLFYRLLFAPEPELQQTVKTAAESLVDEYRRSRVRAVLLTVCPERTRSSSPVTLSSLPQADQETINAILTTERKWIPPQSDPFNSQHLLTNWRWGLVPAERVLQTLGNCLQERMRKDSSESLASAARRIDTSLRSVLAIMDAVTLERERRRPRNAPMCPAAAATLVDQVFRDLRVPSEVSRLVRDATEAFHRAVPGTRGGKWSEEDLVSMCLRVEILTQSFAPPAKALERLTPRFGFLRLGPDTVGPLFHEDWARDIGDRKLYGTRFSHFGAFVSSNWRHSDFTWGRLDAAHHLLPLLLSTDDSNQEEHSLHEAIIEAEGREDKIPHEAAKRMRSRLKELKEKQDRELLSDKHSTTLKNVGDSAIRMVTEGRGKLVLRILLSIWAFVWEGWREGKRLDIKGVIRAAGKPAIFILGIALLSIAAIALGVIAILIVVLVHSW
ncbi:DUF3376 domain-containing protein [Streptomyces sp. NPDC020898]|uniref:DUF3376 domain-containing protein n=1 Tax=Streptomyces sp. NPDC020898 TaxID=3365101 RepID=UPI0037B9C97D